ncbi:hypothetical protein ACZ91_35165 [Streptomyces regensis]|nr:hypothetical protein ACZ91_35165 [Streptomyces regensis]
MLRVACGTRWTSRCPACVWTHAGDTYHLIRDGITGDEREDVPATVRDHPRAFATGPTPTAAAAGVPTPRTTRPLTFTGPMGLPLDRNRFNDRVWRPALRATGVETAGESIKALNEYRT